MTKRERQILISQLREEELPSPEFLPTRLVVRGSTARPGR
jgi:DNA-binding LacI/PurR family transcriptional regulator